MKEIIEKLTTLNDLVIELKTQKQMLEKENESLKQIIKDLSNRP